MFLQLSHDDIYQFAKSENYTTVKCHIKIDKKTSSSIQKAWLVCDKSKALKIKSTKWIIFSRHVDCFLNAIITWTEDDIWVLQVQSSVHNYKSFYSAQTHSAFHKHSEITIESIWNFI